MRRSLVVFLILLCETALAQSWPAKPVRLIVTYPSGGSSELMARVFGAKLGELWGQPVIIESRPGAAGSIGTEYAARQPADGYTLLLGSLQPLAVNPLLSRVPYSSEKDFVPVSLISTGSNVLVVNSDWPVTSIGEVLAYARANPGKLNYGTSGPGSVSHLASEMLKTITRVQALEVPYKGGVLAVQDLLGNQIRFIFSDSLPALQHIRSGRLRALCVTGAQRYSLLPEVPPCAEGGVPGLVAVNWWGVLLPAATPSPIVDQLHADTVRALQDEGVAKRFADLGVETASSTPAQFSELIRAEMAKYSRLIKAADIKGT